MKIQNDSFALSLSRPEAEEALRSAGAQGRGLAALLAYTGDLPAGVRATSERTLQAPLDEVEVHTEELKVYGNFCGPQHGDAALAAKDALDGACKAHDEGYGKNGYFDLGSDLQLIRRLTELQLGGELSLPQRLAAAGIQTAFIALSPISAAVTVTRFAVPAVTEKMTRVAQATAETVHATKEGVKDVAERVWKGVKGWF